MAICVVPNIIRRTPTSGHQSDVVGGVHDRERKVGIPTVAGLLSDCVNVRLKIEDHKVEFLFCGRCNFTT